MFLGPDGEAAGKETPTLPGCRAISTEAPVEPIVELLVHTNTKQAHLFSGGWHVYFLKGKAQMAFFPH